jgi:hypothetical protein
MPQPTGNAAPTWRVGDRAIVESTRLNTARFEGTVTALFMLTDDDADKLRIKYPWIAAGDLVLILMDETGTQRTRLASDPAIRRVIKATLGEERP